MHSLLEDVHTHTLQIIRTLIYTYVGVNSIATPPSDVDKNGDMAATAAPEKTPEMVPGPDIEPPPASGGSWLEGLVPPSLLPFSSVAEMRAMLVPTIEVPSIGALTPRAGALVWSLSDSQKGGLVVEAQESPSAGLPGCQPRTAEAHTTAQAQTDCNTDAGGRVSASTILSSMEESISALTPRLSMSLTNGLGLSLDTLGDARHGASLSGEGPSRFEALGARGHSQHVESSASAMTTPRSASASAAAAKEAAAAAAKLRASTIRSVQSLRADAQKGAVRGGAKAAGTSSTSQATAQQSPRFLSRNLSLPPRLSAAPSFLSVSDQDKAKPQTKGRKRRNTGECLYCHGAVASPGYQAGRAAQGYTESACKHSDSKLSGQQAVIIPRSRKSRSRQGDTRQDQAAVCLPYKACTRSILLHV